MQIETEALIFDMDGLLIDSEPVWGEVERELARGHGLTAWSDEVAARCVGKGLAHLVAVMREVAGLPLSVSAGVEALVDGFIARVGTLSLQPGAGALLDASEGLPRALATSSPRRLAEAVLAHFGLASRFDVVVTASDVAHAKPAPDIFLAAVRGLGTRGVVLEDSLAGVTAARAAELTVIAVPEHAPERFAPLTPYVAADLIEARTWLHFKRA
ncbi:MAG: HAD family phosphatase [Myxococcota bacterium]